MEESLFAEDIRLEDARAAIEGEKGFYAKEEQGGLVIFNYRFCTPATFPDPEEFPAGSRERYLMKVRRECRGLVFDAASGQVVARRLHKFFNVGERASTAPELIDLSRPHLMLTKMDGSLVSAILLEGQARWATKSGFTEMADTIEKRLGEEESAKCLRFSQHWLEQGWTPMFEWCDARAPINIAYPESQLVLLCIRENRTGRYMLHEEVQRLAQEADIRLAPVFEGSFEGAEQLQASIGPREGIEGCVIRFEDTGLMFKVKTSWYFSLSHQKIKGESLLTNERYIWKMILDGTHDDLAAATSDATLVASVEAFAVELMRRLAELEERVRLFCLEHRELDRGDFAKLAKKQDHPGLYFAVRDVCHDDDASMAACMGYIDKYLNSSSRLEEVRGLLGDIKFS